MHPTLVMRMQPQIGLQLVMAGQLLRASTEAVEEILLRELAENPALELARGMSATRLLAQGGAPVGSGEVEIDRVENLAARETVVEQLEAQAVLLVQAADRDVLVNLLHMLDDYGYLRETPIEIARQLGAPLDQVRRMIDLLHQLEPPGLGARDLRECLLLQCAHLQEQGVNCHLATRLLSEAWEELTGQRWGRAARLLDVPLADIEAARAMIARSLCPHPLRMVNNTLDRDEAPFSPDLIIHRVQGEAGPAYRLEIPGETAFQLRLSRTFALNLSARLELAREEREWITAQVERARVFITSLEQRWVTLRLIGEYLLEVQQDFFERGPRWLRPVTRAAVAERLGMHESTVSRAVSDKNILLPDRRLVPLAHLFDASLPVKEALQRMLSEAAAPMSDREIAERLKDEGIDVARRTIGKYREQLRIPNRHARQAV